MSFSVNPKLEARLREIARQQGRDLESVVAEALQSFAEAASRNNGAKQPDRVVPSAGFPLRGSVLRYDDPCKPALPHSDWESAR